MELLIPHQDKSLRAESRSNCGAQPRTAVETVVLECVGGLRNARCSGEMHRYRAEPRLRRQQSITPLTLMHESVGIEQD